MNINGLTPGSTGNEKTRTSDVSARQSSRESQPAQTSGTGDKVELSSQAQILKSMESEVASMSDVDTAKVEQIKSAIQNGDYEIDYDGLAKAIEQFESELE